MEYTEVKISLSPFTEDNADWVVAEIESLGYESFCTEDPFLFAYIRTDRFDEQALADTLTVFKGHFNVAETHAPVQEQNWNAIWEASFSPIVVDGKCTVKATFHKNLPDTLYTITVDPKMAFGTGHHQTTYLMVSSLMNESVSGKRVLDMGCGTGILAILAVMMGASSPVDAIDIDDVAVDSALENFALNNVADNVSVRCGDASSIGNVEKYDIVLANINRNILMSDMGAYSKAMLAGATLLVSGFYADDIPMIVAAAEVCGLEYVSDSLKDEWAVVKFVKK